MRNWIKSHRRLTGLSAVLLILVFCSAAQLVRLEQIFTGGVRLLSAVTLGDSNTFTVESGSVLQIDGTQYVAGSLVISGTLTATNNFTMSLTEQTAVNVTNGQAVTLAGGINYLNGTGSANDFTNTITLARPAGGEYCFVVCANGSTNLIAIAASGAWNSTALELAAGEPAYALGISDIDGTGTNAWRGAEF